MAGRIVALVVLCCIPAWSSAQVITMREEDGARRTLPRADVPEGVLDLFVWPATVTVAGEPTDGAFTVIADPVYRRFWWFFRDTTELQATTPAALADDIERRFIAYPTADRLVVFSPTHRVLRIAFGNDFYASDLGLAALVRSAFAQRAPLLHRPGFGPDGRYDFFDREPSIWRAVGGDFFEDVFNARPQLEPIRIASIVRRDDGGWEIRVYGRFENRLAAVFLSPDFEIERAVRLR